jgi:hypothetical protein
MEDVGRDDRRMQLRAECIEPGKADLADDHRLMREGAARPAIGFRHRGAQQAGRARPGPHLALIHALVMPAVDMRGELRPHEAAGLLFQQDEILGHPGRTRDVEDGHGGVESIPVPI